MTGQSRRVAAAVTALVLSLTGCGKSVEALRSEVVGCTAHLQTIGILSLSPGPAAEFARKLDAETAGSGAKGTAMVQLGTRVAAAKDPAKAHGVAQEGADLARQQVAAGDVSGAATHVRQCLDTYDALVVASR